MNKERYFITKLSKGSIVLPYIIFFIVTHIDSLLIFDFYCTNNWLIFIFASLFCLCIQLYFIVTIVVTNDDLIFSSLIPFSNKTKKYQIKSIEEIEIHNYWVKFSFPYIRIRRKDEIKFNNHLYFPISRVSIKALANELDDLGIDVALLNSSLD